VDQVAHGDFSSKAIFTSRDELGGLTRSFAEMTTQLSDARELVQKSVVQVEGARANLQTILDNLTAGVIVFDRSGAIDTVNPGATRILRLPLSAYRGRRLEEVPGIGPFGADGVAALRDARRQPRGRRARPLAGLRSSCRPAACPAPSGRRSRCWCAAPPCLRGAR
jgi:nitrogen fixation/metabolism regulation signal transduction histidine kinase